MKKGMFFGLMALVVIVCFTVLTSCREGGPYPEGPHTAKGYVPLITRDGKDGKFCYFTPFQDYRKIYPISLMDSVRAVPRTPEAKVSFSTVSKDSFQVSVFAPVERLLSGMDSLYFVYPPDAKFSVCEGIYWTDKQLIALSDKFFIVGIRGNMRNVYTPQGRVLSSALAQRVLSLALRQPADTPVAKDSVP